MTETNLFLVTLLHRFVAGEKLERIGFEWEVPVGQQQSDAIAQVRV